MKTPEEIIQDHSLSPEGMRLEMDVLNVQCLQSIAASLKKAGVTCDMVRDIWDFHEKFDQLYEGKPRALPKETQEFRVKFLQEELNEYYSAVQKKDQALQVDALFDLIYVAMGTLHLMGVDIEAVWNEGHASNMSKELVEKGKGKMGFTVHKGDTYFKPNFKQFV